MEKRFGKDDCRDQLKELVFVRNPGPPFKIKYGEALELFTHCMIFWQFFVSFCIEIKTRGTSQALQICCLWCISCLQFLFPQSVPEANPCWMGLQKMWIFRVELGPRCLNRETWRVDLGEHSLCGEPGLQPRALASIHSLHQVEKTPDVYFDLPFRIC